MKDKFISLTCASLITGYSRQSISRKISRGDFPEPVDNEPPLMFSLADILEWDCKNRRKLITLSDVCGMLNMSDDDIFRLISYGVFPAPVNANDPDMLHYLWKCDDVLTWKGKFSY